MEHLVASIGVAVVLFVSTNVDDIFVLLGFFANPKFRFREIVLGQYLGLGALYAAAVAASLISLVVPPTYVGLLGFFPIAIGVKELWEQLRGVRRSEASDTQREVPDGRGHVLVVAAVTIANGGDNISIYTPLFATRSGADIAVIGSVFAIMTLVWLAIAGWLTNHRTLGAPIRRYGHRIVPFVLIALGVLILHDAGSFALLRSGAAYPRQKLQLSGPRVT